MTHNLQMTAQTLDDSYPFLSDRRQPVRANIEATGFFGDTASLRRQRRRNRVMRRTA